MSGQASSADLKNNQRQSKVGGARAGAGRKPGVPNKATAEIREIARKYTARAIKALAEVMEESESDAARVSAANALLDRGYGKPSQPIDGDGEGGAIIQKIILEAVSPK